MGSTREMYSASVRRWSSIAGSTCRYGESEGGGGGGGFCVAWHVSSGDMARLGGDGTLPGGGTATLEWYSWGLVAAAGYCPARHARARHGGPHASLVAGALLLSET